MHLDAAGAGVKSELLLKKEKKGLAFEGMHVHGYMMLYDPI